MCLSCLPLRCGHCSNISPEINCPIIDSQTSSKDDNGLNDIADFSNTVTTLFNKIFQCAFGTLLLHSAGDCYDNPRCKLWLHLVTFKNYHYDLPNSSVGRYFVTWLSSKIDLLAQGSVHSERVLVFVSTMLQQNPMVGKEQTSVACLAGIYSIGRNTVLKTWLPRLKDVHSGHIYHNLYV